MAAFFFKPKLVTCLKSYNGSTLKKDVLAGLSVGAVALPLAIAFAIASGLKPENGLITAAVAGFLTALLGGSRVSIGGPTGAFIVIVLGIVQQYGVASLLICTMMAGVMLFLLGAFRLGALINYVPYPLISGFTSGIAVIILSSQLRDFFGLPQGPAGSGFISSVYYAASSLSAVNWFSLGLAAASVAILIAWPKKWSRIVPGSIAVLILATLAVKIFGLPVETIGSRFGELASGLPPISMPSLNLATFHFLLGPAITIALLGAIESLLCAVVADGMTGDRHDPNQELMAQGVANFVSPLFGGMPATGAIARTATNIRSGGQTPVSGIIHALVCLLVMLAAGPLAAAVPMCALSAILVMVAINMGQWREFLKLRRYPKSDVTVLLLTFTLTVIFDLTVAVEVGMFAAAVLFIRRVAGLTDVEARPFRLDAKVVGDDDPVDETAPSTDEILIISISGELFFGAAQKLQMSIDLLNKNPKIIILKMKKVFSLDASSLMVMRELAAKARRRGTRIIISGLRGQPWEVVRKSELFDELGDSAFFFEHADSIAAACRAIAPAEDCAGAAAETCEKANLFSEMGPPAEPGGRADAERPADGGEKNENS